MIARVFYLFFFKIFTNCIVILLQSTKITLCPDEETASEVAIKELAGTIISLPLGKPKPQYRSQEHLYNFQLNTVPSRTEFWKFSSNSALSSLNKR